jgi:hypothetical protein
MTIGSALGLDIDTDIGVRRAGARRGMDRGVATLEVA